MKKSEANEQIAVIDYCELRNYPIFAIPNGGSRNQLEAANLKRQGVKSGVPDLCVPVAKHNYHGMYIEMKVGRNKPTDNQIKWLRMLKENGYFVCICYGFDEAAKALDWYFKK